MCQRFCPGSDGLRQNNQRVNGRHFRKDGDRLWTLLRQLPERLATAQRTGKPHRLNRRMANQLRANIGAENHVKNTRRQARGRDRTHYRLGSQLRRRHMPGWAFTTTGQPAASAEAVSPPL